jgi:perosamine synthetase
MIPVNTPLLGSKEREYLINCIETGWISSEGPYVTEFETKMAAFSGRERGIAVCNGTAALEIAVRAIGIKEGDEVIIPTFTIISPAQAVSKLGAKPILVDSDPLTWNMDVSQIEAKITSKTKAIIVVHIYGLPVDLDPVLALCKKHDLKLIEDAAEMHGQTYKGKPCGSFGDASIFSFYPNKHITTGEGGMVVTNSDEIAEKCRSYRNLCFKPEQRFVHDEIGWNYRMTNLQAALGVAQLERIDEFVTKKRWIGKLYDELLQELHDKIEIPIANTDYAENIYWVYGIVLKDSVPMNAKEIMTKLAERGIGSRPFFYPMHLQPVYNKQGWYENESYPVAEKMAERGFYVPSGMALTEDNIYEVVKNLKEILAE